MFNSLKNRELFLNYSLRLALLTPALVLAITPHNAAAANITLACGGNLQSAINSASGGDVIKVAHLQADGVTRCQWNSYTLPARSDSGVVTITTDGALPLPGTRTAPGDSYLALFVSQVVQGYFTVFANAPTTAGHPVHGWAFIGLEITAPNSTSNYSYGLAVFSGYNQTGYTAADIPYNYTFSHCYIHGANPDQQIIRGISADVNDLTVLDSYFSEIHSTVIESNAILGNTTAGNWTIINNDLQGATENFFWGTGAGTLVPGLVPSGLNFRFNYVHKPQAWQTYLINGTAPYIMKDLFEMKEGINATLDSNVFDYSFTQSETAFALVFTPRVGQLSASDPVTTIRNVTVTNNTIRHVVSGITIALYDDNAVANNYITLAQAMALDTKNFTIQNNLVSDMDGGAYGGGPSWGVEFSTYYPYYTQGVNLQHNTFQYGPTAQYASQGIWTNLLPSGCDNFPNAVSPSDFINSYNIFGEELARDCAAGPAAVMGNSTFTNNDINNTTYSNATWQAAFPNDGIMINTTASPDGRGANLTQLSTIEAMVTSGKVCAANVTPQVTIQRGGWQYVRAQNRYAELITVTNSGTQTLQGVGIAFMGLTTSQTASATATAACGSWAGSPYQLSTATSLTPGASTTLTLDVSLPSGGTPTYTPVVLAGPGLY